MGKLISQLERIAMSNLQLFFKGSEILVSEYDEWLHIATKGKNPEFPESDGTEIDFTYFTHESPIGWHVQMLKKEGPDHVVLFASNMDGGSSYPFIKIHRNPADLQEYSVATVATQDYIDRIKELQKYRDE